MMKKTVPFVSIVIATFNRSNRISPCLESLSRQTYPRGCFEVIVVDDASTDDTYQIARARGVRVLRHEINRGIPSARNTGLAAAKGEIVAYIDDDCIADVHWLEYLITSFDNPEIVAAGGRVLAYKTDYLLERYLSAIGYGNPAPLEFGKSNNPLWRFWVYLKSMFSPIGNATKFTEVQAIFTSNAAYHTLPLRAIGGFDETLFSEEDTDVSSRFRKRGGHIIFVPNATVYHRHRESLSQLIRQTYRRGVNTLHYYVKERKILPIFPLPLFYVIMAICLVVTKSIIGFLFVILGPLVLYVWWPIKAFRDLRLEYLVYGYIQLALESAAILGMASKIFRGMESKTITT